MEDSEDKSEDSFSPQNFQSHRNHQKLEMIRSELTKQGQQKEELVKKQENLNYKLRELERVILLCKENESFKVHMKKKMDEDELLRIRLLETQEWERHRIARDLHDSAVQNLSSVIHHIELCTKLIDMDPERCKRELNNMSKLVRNVIQDMRQTIYNLHPASLDDMGLDVTIQREIDRLKRSYDIDIEFKSSGSDQGLLPVIPMTLYRIVQECCSNSIQHADANKITIDIRYEEQNIYMTIEDDGRGFDVAKVRRESAGLNKGFGISNIYERVHLLSGTIDIQSEIDHGTRLEITIPKKGKTEYADTNYAHR
jgi:two-component system sensor histidine kinase DegS